MEPKAFTYLLKKQEDMESDKDKENAASEDGKEETDSKIGIEKKKLEQALKHARLERQAPTDEMFSEVVDVSAALSNQTRYVLTMINMNYFQRFKKKLK